MGVKSPQPFDTLFDSFRCTPFSLALHLCSSYVITKWCKIYTKLTLDFKNQMNFDNFRQAAKSKKLKFNGLHLSKNYIPSPKTLFTDLSNITFNWLVVWKMTWGIWQIFTRALQSLKIGILMGSFNQSWKSMSLKSTEELSVMTMKNDAKL